MEEMTLGPCVNDTLSSQAAAIQYVSLRVEEGGKCREIREGSRDKAEGKSEG